MNLITLFKNKFPFFLLFITLPVFAQKDLQLRSPDGNIIFSFELTEEAPTYRVSYKGETLIEDSKLGLSFKESGGFEKNLEIRKPEYTKTDKIYELVVGKASIVRDHHNEVIIPLKDKKTKRQINLIVRAFNDGLAFRYEFPEQKAWSSYIMTEERSTFNIAGDPMVKTFWWDEEQYTNNHEGLYHTLPFNELPVKKLIEMPSLFEFPGEIYMAITEANLRDYAGMYLIKNDDGVLKSQLAPLPGQEEIKVKATLPHYSPWRVMMISDRIGALIESNIITSLNEPTEFEDTSWIKPGKTTFHWWNGDVIPDTTITPGINFEFNKYYIDFAARNDIEYHSVIGYGGVPWYFDDGSNYGHPGPNADARKQRPGLNLERISDYAHKKGVGIHVWVHWKAIYPHIEETFAKFEEWGVDGMMIDYLDRTDQEMVNIQEEMLQIAAEHELFIQFHGVFKPTGLHRTYPNEFTREGTWNYERNKWIEGGVTPDHDLDVVFTRLLAGATDYHLGGFRAVPKSEYKTQFTRPLMLGTRCHMLAMYVVLESYLASLCDYPKAYEGKPGFEFLKKVPTTWDETFVPNAEVGEYVTVARRKGTDWYVGSLNNSTSRTINIPLDFLSPGNYIAEIYTDAEDVAQNPNHLNKKKRTVDRNDVITIELAAGGGQVMHLVKK